MPLAQLPAGHVPPFDAAVNLYVASRNGVVKQTHDIEKAYNEIVSREGNDRLTGTFNDLYDEMTDFVSASLRECRLFDLSQVDPSYFESTDEKFDSPFPVVGLYQKCKTGTSFVIVNIGCHGTNRKGQNHVAMLTIGSNLNTEPMSEDIIKRYLDEFGTTREHISDENYAAGLSLLERSRISSTILYDSFILNEDGTIDASGTGVTARLSLQKSGNVIYDIVKQENAEYNLEVIRLMLGVLTNPAYFVLEGAPTNPVTIKGNKAKQIEKKRVKKSAERPIHVLLKPHQIREALKLDDIERGDFKPEDKVKRGAHERRGHWATLRNERYERNADGSFKRVWKKHTWIGPSTATINRRIYRVILDRPEDNTGD